MLQDDAPLVRRMLPLYPELRHGSSPAAKRSIRTAFIVAALMLDLDEVAAASTSSDRQHGSTMTNVQTPGGLLAVDTSVHAILDALGDRPTVVVGPPGVGKSSVCALAIQEVVESYDIVWRFAAGTPEGLKRDAHALARAMALPSVSTENPFHDVALAVEQEDLAVLFLLEDLRGREELLALGALPGHVLVTSRARTGWRPDAATVPVEVLGHDDATRVILERSGEDDWGLASRLASAAENLPVALDHLGRVAEIDGLEAVVSRAEAARPQTRVDQLPPAFVESVQAQSRRLAEIHPQAHAVLAVSACLARDPIPRALLERRFRDLATSRHQQFAESSDKAADLRMIAELGLADLNPEHLKVHPLTAEIVTAQCEQQELLVRISEALALLADAFEGVSPLATSMELDQATFIVSSCLSRPLRLLAPIFEDLAGDAPAEPLAACLRLLVSSQRLGIIVIGTTIKVETDSYVAGAGPGSLGRQLWPAMRLLALSSPPQSGASLHLMALAALRTEEGDRLPPAVSGFLREIHGRLLSCFPSGSGELAQEFVEVISPDAWPRGSLGSVQPNPSEWRLVDPAVRDLSQQAWHLVEETRQSCEIHGPSFVVANAAKVRRELVDCRLPQDAPAAGFRRYTSFRASQLSYLLSAYGHQEAAGAAWEIAVAAADGSTHLEAQLIVQAMLCNFGEFGEFLGGE